MFQYLVNESGTGPGHFLSNSNTQVTFYGIVVILHLTWFQLHRDDPPDNS